MSAWRWKNGATTLRVAPSGHCYLSSAAAELLGNPREVVIAARDGALIILAATDGDHRAYLASSYVTEIGTKVGARISARKAVRLAGLLQETSVKYQCIECEDEEGRTALYVRADMQAPVARRGLVASQEVAA